MGNSEVGHINIGSGRVRAARARRDRRRRHRRHVRDEPRATSVHQPREGERRHAASVRLALRRPRAQFARSPRSADRCVRARERAARDRRVSRRSRHAAAQRASLHRSHRAYLATHGTPGPHHEHLRTLLCDGSRQALGARGKSVRAARTRRARAPRRDGDRSARRRLRARRERRIRAADRDRRRRSPWPTATR